MEITANWIAPASGTNLGQAAPLYERKFSLSKPIFSASLMVTAMGVYEARLNGERIGQFVMAPGWTSYDSRLQYQVYDVTKLLRIDNTLSVLVGKGWYRSPLPGFAFSAEQDARTHLPAGVLAQLDVTFQDGDVLRVVTDSDWLCGESEIRFSELYDGEVSDATVMVCCNRPVQCFDGPTDTLMPQEGEEIREQEMIFPHRIFTTPKGETVVDFGQNLTGYVQTVLDAHSRDTLDISFAEVLDAQGNFYTDNYRSAKAICRFTCSEGRQTCKPRLTFWGFRYIRVNQFPGGVKRITPDTFTAIAVHSDMRRTGEIQSSDPLLNQLFANVVWGQKSNFLDIPTDCPQRDERLGWTGDAQVFVRTACLNYDAEKFFSKWLHDLIADQREDGGVGHVVPDVLKANAPSAAWGDAATICPWEVFQAYGNKELLRECFPAMVKWVEYISRTSTTPFLWTGGTSHYGDWLGLDAEPGSYKGATNEELIASAFYARSTELVVKAGRVLSMNVEKHEILYQKIVNAFRQNFTEYPTQTACVLAAHFRLAENCQTVADQLAGMIRQCGHLRTGFVGTPYLLHVLSDFGHIDLAYQLLMRHEYPSWLYPITKGATTIWEHWDGIREDGRFWSDKMNSYNHYAYGSVMDWVYAVAGGIRTEEDAPGYGRIRFAPHPGGGLEWLTVTLQTRHGLARSSWKRFENGWAYDIITPVEAQVEIDGTVRTVPKGSYRFYSAGDH